MFAKKRSRLPNIRLLRLVKSLSQDELGLAIGLSGSYVSRIERGLVEIPPRVRTALVQTLGDAAASAEPLSIGDPHQPPDQERA